MEMIKKGTEMKTPILKSRPKEMKKKTIRIGAIMVSINQVGLLVLLLMEIHGEIKFCPPQTCKCDFNGVSTCNLNNSTITLKFSDLDSADSSLTMECQGKSFACSDLPEFGTRRVRKIISRSCPPRILRCINKILVDVSVEKLNLSDVYEPVMNEDVAHLEDALYLDLSLRDENTLLSAASINSWANIIRIHIINGYLNLTNVSLVQENLFALMLKNTKINSIPTGAFTGLSNVGRIELSGCNVETGIISAGAFKGLASLRHIEIQNSGIKIIESGAFSGANYIKSLDLRDNPFQSLPNGFLEGVQQALESISIRCSIKDQVELNLGSHAFADLNKLGKLSLMQCKLNELEDTLLRNCTTVKSITIANNSIHNMSSEIFTNLNSLTTLNLQDNDLKEIPNGIFDNLRSLIALDLSDNKIANIHENIFNDLISLNELLLTNNKIQTLREEIFFSLTSLKSLKLDHNSIQALPENIFSNLTSLDSLWLNNNNIDALSEDIFAPLISLTTLYLNNNYIQTLSDGIFSSLSSLTLLNLENNIINKLPMNIFSGLSLNFVNLAKNNITDLVDMIFGNMSSLTTLYLNDNKIKRLDIFEATTSMEILSLAHNELEYLPDFYEMRNLVKLDLSDNNLGNYEFYSFSFRNFQNLTELYLQNNNISKLVQAYRGESSFVSSLKALRKVDLSGNKLRQFYAHWEDGVTQLRELNLSGNYLTDFTIFQVDYSNLSITIDLQHNYLSEVLLNTTGLNSTSVPSTQSRVLLNNNPIICDCNAHGLLLRSKGARLYGEPQYILDNVRCTAPENLKGKILTDVSPIDLECELNKYRPKDCSSFIAKADSNEIILNCSKLPTPFPDVHTVSSSVTFFDPPKIILKLGNQPDNIEHINIHTLDLSNTGMNSVNFKLTNSPIKVLNLSNNKLDTLPEHVFNTNVTLYLSNNPFQCTCALVTKLKKYRSLADSELVMCANEGKKLTDVDADEICNRTDSLISVIGTTAVVGLFLLLIAVAACKYVIKNWTNITKSLRRRDRGTVEVDKRHCDVATKYDIFMSFPFQDEEFVRENLLPKLQFEYNQKVCVKYRDWTVENLSPEQIRQSVDESSKTIIVLSEHFLTSEWCYLEFARAHSLSKRDGVPRVIIVSLTEDIIKEEGLSDELKSYIQTDSHLRWGDDNFWQNIKNNLPK